MQNSHANARSKKRVVIKRYNKVDPIYAEFELKTADHVNKIGHLTYEVSILIL